MEDTVVTLKKRFGELPKDVQKAILSVDTSAAFMRITTKHALSIDQAGKLENETTFVMLGFEHPTDFTKNLQKSLGLSEEKIRDIAQDINEQIFRPIKDSLRKIHGLESDATTIQKTTAEKILELNLGAKEIPKKPEFKMPPYIPPIPPKVPRTTVATVKTTPPSVTPPPSAITTTQESGGISSHVDAYQKRVEEQQKKQESSPKIPEDEANLNKENLLAGIEDPSSIPKAPSATIQSPTLPNPQPVQKPKPIIKEYVNDPYREPLK